MTHTLTLTKAGIEKLNARQRFGHGYILHGLSTARMQMAVIFKLLELISNSDGGFFEGARRFSQQLSGILGF